ncbi:hypothetical protein [Burkholderia sp. LMG 32019]|uniref:hypothetical protein n=1 Tax=Burkholderia sp. LMG 32019 TaxID=3158173 RepID=UPI003C2D9FF3
MRESIEQKDRSTITNLSASIAEFPLRFIACRSAMIDTRPARPIVTRCGLPQPDARQARTRRATRAGKREKYRRTGL